MFTGYPTYDDCQVLYCKSKTVPATGPFSWVRVRVQDAFCGLPVTGVLAVSDSPRMETVREWNVTHPGTVWRLIEDLSGN